MAKVTEEQQQSVPQWDTNVKLGAIEEANYVAVGDVVVGIDRASGEIVLRGKQQHGRSREVA